MPSLKVRDFSELSSSSKCGDCLTFHTPHCAHANNEDISNGYDLFFPNDLACSDFFPLEERLKLEKIYAKIEEQDLNQYVIDESSELR